jgi:hypothetical protein
MKRLLVAIVALAALPLAAATIRLDDSASPKRRLDLKPRWVHEQGEIGSPDRLNAMVANVPAVEIRLNTAAHVGKRGRIYLVMPAVVPGLMSPNAMRLEWRTRGVFQEGSALPGERRLLYDGPISQPSMNDHFDFNVFFDARQQAGALRFDPSFELEVLP